MDSTVIQSLWRGALSHDAVASQNRWRVAREAYRACQDGNVNDFARLIADIQGNVPIDDKAPTDTVYRLSHAYALFIVLAKMDFDRARIARRRYSYTRFDTIYLMWIQHEFDPSKLWDYLDYQGGNRAVSAFIDNNENPAPEWERRAYAVNKLARKLKDDFGVPDGLQKAAVKFVEEFEKWELL